MILQIYTIIQTLISLVAGKRLDGWTKWFLVTAVATTITEFSFADFDHLTSR